MLSSKIEIENKKAAELCGSQGRLLMLRGAPSGEGGLGCAAGGRAWAGFIFCPGYWLIIFMSRAGLSFLNMRITKIYAVLIKYALFKVIEWMK